MSLSNINACDSGNTSLNKINALIDDYNLKEAPDQLVSENSQKIANTAFVKLCIAALVDSSPAALDTLNELAAALGDDANFSTTVLNALAGKEPTIVTLPIAKGGTNSNTALNNNRLMASIAGAIKELAVLTSGKLIFTDANGLPITTPGTPFNPDMIYDYINGKMDLQFGGTVSSDINLMIRNYLQTVAATIYFMGNGAMGLGTLPGLADKMNINGKLRLSQTSGVGAALQIDVLNAVIGGTSSPLAKLDLLGGGATRPTLYQQAQADYVGAIIEGATFNSSTKKSLVEQQLIGNKVLMGFLSGATRDSNTIANTGAIVDFTTNGHQFTVPANSLTVGKRLRINFRGRYGTAAAAPTISLHFRINGVTVMNFNFPGINNQANRGFKGSIEIRIDQLGVTGNLNACLNAIFNSTTPTSGSILPNTTNKVIDTTIANVLGLAASFSTANVANTITMEDTTYEVLN